MPCGRCVIRKNFLFLAGNFNSQLFVDYAFEEHLVCENFRISNASISTAQVSTRTITFVRIEKPFCFQRIPDLLLPYLLYKIALVIWISIFLSVLVWDDSSALNFGPDIYPLRLLVEKERSVREDSELFPIILFILFLEFLGKKASMFAPIVCTLTPLLIFSKRKNWRRDFS